MNSKGFTLIELLVVVAIIGILASVVLASLNSARGKGSDAAAKSNLAGTRSQAELYYDTNSAYSSVTIASYPANSCSTANSIFDSTATNSVKNQVNAANSATGNTAVCILNGTNGNKANSWGIAVQLKTTGTYFCVDSNGSAKLYSNTTSPAASAVTGASGTGAMTTGGVCN